MFSSMAFLNVRITGILEDNPFNALIRYASLLTDLQNAILFFYDEKIYAILVSIFIQRVRV